MEVNVPESRVQWGRCLRVRVCLDVIKRLVRGKKITIGGGESWWINFKYERLLNFYYRCGLLTHALKECPEKVADSNQAMEECLQYGTRMRGEPLRRNDFAGGGTTQTRPSGNADISQRMNAVGTTKHTELTHGPNEDKESDGGHVLSPSNREDSHPWEITMLETLGNPPEVLHENGNVKERWERLKRKQPI